MAVSLLPWGSGLVAVAVALRQVPKVPKTIPNMVPKIANKDCTQRLHTKIAYKDCIQGLLTRLAYKAQVPKIAGNPGFPAGARVPRYLSPGT